MRKPFTEEEKNEIAELYRDGRPVNEIARKFGRPPGTIYKIVSSMGVNRRSKPKAAASKPPSDQPKKESALKKPWYLKT